ncbi:hypothetical protein [Jiangella muralis]|uniref:hypothetical protein n=1 Tax=Jiangella muralis TaxID=702383 RepID=UPI00069F3C86|nr:hypothetical protein [Jiangella muralis]
MPGATEADCGDPQLDTALAEHDGELYTEVDETNDGSNALFAGFGARRISGNIEIVHRRSA